jgi:hypothetical protein
MEVSGYPHYENVASNILAFYFDPLAEHNLKDLLVSAFLQMVGIKELPPVGELLVRREHITDEGKRIDLIIDGEGFTIGIENKIYHTLANDLEQYGKVIDRLGREKNVIKAVLSVHSIQSAERLKGGFSCYTYAQLWQEVREMLGHYISKADQKWVTFLIDFIDTTTNLAGQNMELQKVDNFFIEHDDLIEKMLAERKAFLERLNNKVRTLCTMLSEAGAAATLSRPPWIYKDSCVVLDFKFADAYTISFDLVLRPTGWELQLFGRNNTSLGYLRKLLGKPALEERVGNATLNEEKRYILQAWPIQKDLATIKETVCSWMDALINAAKTVSN